MSSKTKILVLKRREIIYTGIFIILAVLLIILAYCMFKNSDTQQNSNKISENNNTNANSTVSADELSAASNELLYTPGYYTSTILLGTQTLEVWVCVDADHINSMGYTSIDEAITTMYPLMESTMADLESQILHRQSLNITYSEDRKYTSAAILDALDAALSKAIRNPA